MVKMFHEFCETEAVLRRISKSVPVLQKSGHRKSRCGGVLDDPAPCSAPAPRAPSRFSKMPKRKYSRCRIKTETQHSATPNHLFRSVGVLYVLVVSPEYSLFSGLTTETLFFLTDSSVGLLLCRFKRCHKCG